MDLVRLIHFRDARGIVAALAGLPESERRALAPPVVEYGRRQSRNEHFEWDRIRALELSLAGRRR